MRGGGRGREWEASVDVRDKLDIVHVDSVNVVRLHLLERVLDRGADFVRRVVEALRSLGVATGFGDAEQGKGSEDREKGNGRKEENAHLVALPGELVGDLAEDATENLRGE
jgi:hypothetical protein